MPLPVPLEPDKFISGENGSASLCPVQSGSGVKALTSLLEVPTQPAEKHGCHEDVFEGDLDCADNCIGQRKLSSDVHKLPSSVLKFTYEMVNCGRLSRA